MSLPAWYDVPESSMGYSWYVLTAISTERIKSCWVVEGVSYCIVSCCVVHYGGCIWFCRSSVWYRGVLRCIGVIGCCVVYLFTGAVCLLAQI